MLDSNGDKAPPCGVPSSVSINTPFTITHDTKNFLIINNTFPSLIVLFRICINLS